MKSITIILFFSFIAFTIAKEVIPMSIQDKIESVSDLADTDLDEQEEACDDDTDDLFYLETMQVLQSAPTCFSFSSSIGALLPSYDELFIIPPKA